MENDNGLELSLGLSCGGSAAKSEGKNSSSIDIRTEDGERTNKIVADFKNFLNAVDQRQESGGGPQISTSDKPQENFFTQLSKCSDAVASTQSNGKGLWVPESHRSAESEEERRESGSKRNTLYEINHQKKLDIGSNYSDLHLKSRTSLFSLTTDGSNAENEDIAESEVETSTSKTIRTIDTKMVESQAQKRFKNSSDSNLKMGTFASFSGQLANSGKESSSIGAFGTSSHPLPSMTQAMRASSNEQLEVKPAVPRNLPLVFGYSPVQLPMLDKNNSLGQISHAQQLHPSYIGRRGSPQPDSMHVTACNPLEPTNYDVKIVDQAKGDGKQHVAEEGCSSSQNGNGVNGGNTSFREKDTSDPSRTEFISLDFPAIKPGIAADLRFRGSGSHPNLPWVSTSGPGPNGRTISGVTYRCSTSQIKIVCACHGSHMSPEDFIRHASDGDPVHPNNNAVTSS